MTPRQSLIANLGLSLLVSALLVLSLEGLARLFEPPRDVPPVARYLWNWDEKWSGDFYTVRSGASGWPPWQDWNADGVRDRAHPVEKLEGFRRLVFLGDSVTLGTKLKPRQAYPQALQERLDESGARIEVFNVALWGWSTRQQAIAYRRIARKYAPDAVVVGVCLNDIPELQNNLSRPQPWLALLHRRSALVRRLIDAEGREIRAVEDLFAQPEAPRVKEAFERFFAEVRALRDEVRADGARFALLVFPFRFQLAADAPAPSVQQRIAAFCAAESIPCLDPLPRFRSLDEGVFRDYDHLTARGARVTAVALQESDLLPEAPAESTLVARGGASLTAADADTRAAAAWELGQDGKAVAVDGLAAALRRDSSPLVRFRAAEALGALGAHARPAAAALFESLRDEREPVRWSAAQALWKLGLQAPEDLDPLVESLSSGDPYVRAFAAWSLGEMGPAARQAVPALLEVLRLEKNESGAAAQALAKLGPAAAEAVPALAEQLNAPDVQRRRSAAEALGRIGPSARTAVADLVAALRDENEQVRSSAAQALGRIGPDARAAVPALARVLEGDDEPQARAMAARSLGQIGPASRDALASLDRAKDDPRPSVRREVEKALPRIHGQ